ncbi:MAG: hypothetical protein ACP5O2_04585 [Bacteroidales bacterium]
MKKTVLLFLNVFIVVSGLYAQKKNPSLLLDKGQTLNYQVTADIDMTQSMMGQELQSKINSSSQAIFTVEDIQQGNYLIRQMLKDVEMHMKMQEMDTTFRMAEQSNFPALLVGKDGKVLSHTQSTDTKSKGGFSPDMAGNTTFVPFVEFPNYTVKKGESWNTTYNDTTLFAEGLLINKVKTAYTLEGEEKKDGKKCLKISYKSTIENEGSTSMQGMEFYIEGSGAMHGTQWIDAKTGILVVDESVMENQMSLSLSGQQNFVIPLSMKTQVVRKLIP